MILLNLKQAKAYWEYLANAGLDSVYERGNPEPDDPIHMWRNQHRDSLGFREGIDFGMNVVCWNGNYHIRYARTPELVTCECCLERISGPHGTRI